jgi:hypothetical protein
MENGKLRKKSYIFHFPFSIFYSIHLGDKLDEQSGIGGFDNEAV